MKKDIATQAQLTVVQFCGAVPLFPLLPQGVPVSEWISVKRAAEYTGYTGAHIRYLLAKGLVEGRKFGRDWFTTEEALDRYLATNPRPGPSKTK